METEQDSPGCWESVRVGAAHSEVQRTMPVYVHRPDAANSFRVIVLLQEIFGVDENMKDLASRMAREGYLALVPDLFYREGDHFTGSSQDMDSALARAGALKEEGFLADMNALMKAYVRDGQAVAAMGFCMGGRLAYLMAATQALDAAVSFYGGGIVKSPHGPIKRTSEIHCPVLLLFGGKDAHIPAKDIEQIRQALRAHQKEYEIIVYPEAGHGFFRTGGESFHASSAVEAWKSAKDFLNSNLR